MKVFTEGRKDNSLQFLQNMPHKRAFQFQKHSEAVNELLTLKDVIIIFQSNISWHMAITSLLSSFSQLIGPFFCIDLDF